jgi:hypothetical protein
VKRDGVVLTRRAAGASGGCKRPLPDASGFESSQDDDSSTDGTSTPRQSNKRQRLHHNTPVTPAPQEDITDQLQALQGLNLETPPTTPTSGQQAVPRRPQPNRDARPLDRETLQSTNLETGQVGTVFHAEAA